jgi:hypothetical protein
MARLKPRLSLRLFPEGYGLQPLKGKGFSPYVNTLQ